MLWLQVWFLYGYIHLFPVNVSSSSGRTTCCILTIESFPLELIRVGSFFLHTHIVLEYCWVFKWSHWFSGDHWVKADLSVPQLGAKAAGPRTVSGHRWLWLITETWRNKSTNCLLMWSKMGHRLQVLVYADRSWDIFNRNVRRISTMILWACVYVYKHTQHFPFLAQSQSWGPRHSCGCLLRSKGLFVLILGLNQDWVMWMYALKNLRMYQLQTPSVTGFPVYETCNWKYLYFSSTRCFPNSIQQISIKIIPFLSLPKVML